MQNWDTIKVRVVPIGGSDPAVLFAVRQALGRTFDALVTVAPEEPLPSEAYNLERHQYLALLIIHHLALIGAEGVKLGIIEGDIYAQGMDYIFGEADRERASAVISLARLRKGFYGGREDEGILIRRAEKEAVHEVGHIIGLSHCPIKTCVMHYSNNIAHTDKKSPNPCPACADRLMDR